MVKGKELNKSSSNLPSNFVIKAGDIDYIKPALFDGGYKGTFTAIKNACDEIWGDERGNLFVNSAYLDRILRTKSFVAKEILVNIPREEKLIFQGVTYVTLGEIMKIVTKRLQELPVGKTRSYLLLAEQFLINIRDNDKFINKRTEMQLQLIEEFKTLKKKRIKRYKIENDELTGKILLKGAQFSHIRAKSIYPAYALNIDNGLIVNVDTHEIITARAIVNEESLLNLCEELGWKTDWYIVYKNLVL